MTAVEDAVTSLTDTDLSRSARVFEALGARGVVLDELLTYAERPGAKRSLPALPLPDEVHLQDWAHYAVDARREGVFAALRRRLVQLRFPVAPGVSTDASYLAATRRGVWPAADRPDLVLERPDDLALALHPTPAGRIPVLTVGHRADFETLVCALARRNEREAVPSSMGACIVTGLNNWDRVARYRRHIERERGAAINEEEWSDELRRLAPRKELYQDRLLLLSRGPYSAVSAVDAGVSERAWRDASLTIRREHECFHFLTSRAFGCMHNHALDELLADFVGLVRAFGEYDAALARRLLGIEDGARFRPGGRLANYRGDPPLSDAPFAILCSLAARCTENLACLAERHSAVLVDPHALARLSLELYAAGLRDLSGIAERAPPHCDC